MFADTLIMPQQLLGDELKKIEKTVPEEYRRKFRLLCKSPALTFKDIAKIFGMIPE